MAKFFAITDTKMTNLTGKDLWQGETSSVFQETPVQEQRTPQQQK